MVKLYIFLFLIVFSSLRSQKTYLSENFDYPAGALLNENGWYAHSAGTNSPIAVTADGLSWSKTPYIGSGKGRAAAVVTTGSDENRPFSSWADTMSVYGSFLVKANAEVTTATSGYFFHFVQYATPSAPVFTSTNTSFRARVYSAPGSSVTKFKIGITFNSTTVTDGGQSEDLNVGETYLVVAKYTFISGADNDVVSLYVFKDGDKIDVEPATTTAGPFGRTGTTIAPDLSSIQGVALRQFAANQNITIDGIYVRNHWNMTTESTDISCNHPDYVGLMALYRSTNGLNWTNNTGWKEGASGTSCDPCNHNGQPWYGIGCENGRVTCIDLDGVVNCSSNQNNIPGNNLIGTIPNSLNSLNNLKFLYLRNNKLSGSIPNFNLPNLQILSLGSNLLSGSIPNFNMPNLQILSLGSNQLNGSIPDLDLPSLEQLSLGSNQLNGEIPKKIENLYNLQILRLDANRFAGPIPIELCNLTNLNTLSLTSNEFIGEIPNEIEKLKKLKYLNLSGNNLDGELPIEIFELINLNQLIISFNQINGTIPKEIGKLKNLTFINLSFNKLGGQIPLELCDLQNLRQINLHNNKLNGQIPNELGKLKSLQFLYLHDNLLNGQIPKELGSLQNLQSLGLDKNSLDGTIPKEIGNLSNLYQLRLNNNRFSGCLDPYLKIFCKDSVRIEIFSGIFRTYKMEVNLSDNPLLPWQGDFSKFCTTDGSFEKQRGVPCDDGDPQTINDSIQVDCSCKGTIQCGTHPDFATLESIYILTNGDNWKNNTGWKDRNIAGKCDPCNGWYGISCKNGRVDSINFFDNKLDGRLLNLKSLEKLRFFSCRDNLLKGQVPEVYENLELEVLDLRGNSFSGKAPNISKNIKLKYFDISFNKFTDSFPSISNNKDIEIISCRFNQMIGPLPNLSNNLNLIDVNFGDNSFSGSIPDLTNCVKLESFACYFNSLTGSIPDISKNIKIKHFGCYVNQLTGEIPTLTKNINLEGFSCGNNSIQGQIPNLDANINLGDFSCSTNSLSGSIPDLKKLTRLHSFDCSNNKLTGNIPDFSNQKDELVNGWDNFNFSNNDLSGCYNNSICKFINIPIRFNGNPKLPNKGNHIPFCAGVSQIGASCDNGNTADGTADIIDQNCNCVSGCRSGFGLISGAKEICTGSISTLTASGGFQYRWNNGSTSNSITISPSISSTFIVTVTDTLGCVATASKTVSINTLPHAKIAGDPVMCPGGNTTLGATGGTSYLWNNGVTTGSNFIKAPGKYIVTVTDANGCTARDSVTVITLDAGKQPIPKDDTLYVDEDIVYDLDLLANDVLYTQNITVRYGKNLGNDIRFTSQSPDGKVKLYAERRFTEALTLTYEICDQCDQCASAKLIILPEKLKNIIQTTLITPLESANNTLQFSDVPISDSELWVYNRWGQQVFHAKGYKNDWDADGVPGGVYYYVFKVYGFTIKKALTVVK